MKKNRKSLTASDGNACRNLFGSPQNENDNDPLERDWLSKSLQRLAGKYTAVQETNVSRQKEEQMTNNHMNEIILPFTIITWNIWFSSYEWKARLEAALSQILLQEPDVFCFQEVTAEVHKCMLQCHYLRKRYEPTELRLPQWYDVAIWIKKDDDTASSSIAENQGRSIKVHACKTIELETIFGRRGLCLDLEISANDHSRGKRVSSRVRVVSTHLESKKENGKIRERQLDHLFNCIRDMPWKTVEAEKESNKEEEAGDYPIVSLLVGDFNIDPAYPENTIVESNSIDLWKILRPNDYGFTEDTYVNKMRYEKHGYHKQVRYDRIVLVPTTLSDDASILLSQAHPCSIDRLGTEPFDDEGRLWVSDHFGLVARLRLRMRESSSSSRNSFLQDAKRTFAKLSCF